MLVRFGADGERPSSVDASGYTASPARSCILGVGRCQGSHVGQTAGLSLSGFSLGPALGHGLLTLALIIFLTSCSSDSPRVSSLHYVEVVTSDDGQQPAWRFEVFYQSPDSLRVTYPSAFPFSEAILIGSQAWKRYQQGWSVVDPDSVLGLARVQEILAVSSDLGEFEDLGAGPTLSGETTRRYRQVSDGENVLEDCYSVPRDVLDVTRDLFRDVEVTTEIVVGERTSHVYRIDRSLIGPNLSAHQEIRIDQYDVPVTIDPPVDVLPTPESTQSTLAQARCPTP